MDVVYILIVCALVLLARGHQYTPESVSGGSCSDLPVDLHTAVKQRIEELEDKLELTDQLNGLAASIEALNTSLQQQVSKLAADVRNIQTVIGNLSSGSTTPAPTSLGTFLNPAASCKQIPPDSPSGDYWIQNNKTSSSIQVYCDMTRNCSGISGGWMRVANLNMSDPAQNCPDGYRLINRATPPLRTCGRPSSTTGCVSTVFSVYEPTYTHVCGRVIGYQYGSASAFTPGAPLSSTYLSGISLTYGSHQHIWSFAVADSEVSDDPLSICPCTRPDLTHTLTVTPAVGEDYFCETGSENTSTHSTFYDMDPLWDGEGCGGSSTCCEFNNPPWFSKPLSQQIPDDIEFRLCHSAAAQFHDVPFEIMELYVR